MRILFMGTPEFAASYLDFLIQKKFNVVAVISQKDKPRGRGQKLLPTPVKEVAQKYGIPVFQPSKLNEEGLEIIENYRPDIGIVVAYGRLLRKPFLDAIPLYNVHTSLLPKYRGPAPMQRAIENGERVTGVTIFKISEGMDEGDIALQRAFELEECEPFGSVYEKFIKYGTELLREFLRNYPVTLTPQDHSKATYAPKIEKKDLYVDFSKPAVEVRNKIRAYDPTPGVRTFLNDIEVKLYGACEIENNSQENIEPGTVLRIEKQSGDGVIKTINGLLHIKYIQFPGKNKITFLSAKNGGLIKEGMIFRNLD
ncbi:MAG TPA: methionyl-tRNA formyltransferase [Fervidobacterium nodosum]|nr:methionyl-tRNA formyltransferase [Fervidobacterium nodosum]